MRCACGRCGEKWPTPSHFVDVHFSTVFISVTASAIAVVCRARGVHSMHLGAFSRHMSGERGVCVFPRIDLCTRVAALAVHAVKAMRDLLSGVARALVY
jgi:hypothetical protein